MPSETGVFWLAFFLSIAQFAGFWLDVAFHKNRFVLTSLSAGMFTVVLFMDMLRQAHSYYSAFGEIVLAALLFGFVIFHVLHKTIYQHTLPGSRKRASELAWLGIGSAVVEDFALGFLLVLLFTHLNTTSLIPVLFLPFLLRAFAASIFLSELALRFKFSWLKKALLCLPILLGALAAALLQLEQELLALTFSFLIGAFFYIVTREMIPSGKQGHLSYYLLGLAFGLLAFYLSGM